MTYTYKCLECNKEITIEKGINEEVEAKCQCGSLNIKRIFVPISSVWNCTGAFGKSK